MSHYTSKSHDSLDGVSNEQPPNYGENVKYYLLTNGEHLTLCQRCATIGKMPTGGVPLNSTAVCEWCMCSQFTQRTLS